ncbi:hypothetical protein PLESTB_000992200 [Pleodorina starrii]|uniref:SET domain-containing protein n=1 Tax=Pleodorina starrii TaxID=330485 RepID=A0A9W6F436_9CHLO|nr:hypothetical protein PLESTM_000555200 [Pleodorina starrii]GLC55484.1 hypothetical protein PLESTB_000992200 [Pleodorina starrii]GLC73879.1 hypothetical protein PLESTF_001430900 [Pleodorina starrii]
MSSSVRLGLLAFSAGVAALVVALVLPYTDPESLAVLTSHPIGARAANLTSAAIRGFARLLEGASSETTGPSLRRYHPLAAANVSANAAAAKHAAAPAADDHELDWSDPEVWRLQQQQQQTRGSFYTEAEMGRLLHWCGDGGDGNSSGAGDGAVAEAGAEAGAEATAGARFERLAAWIAANGGDASKVRLGVDGDGVRGLHAARDIAAGEVALSVPLKTGLSAATFRAARVLAGPTASWRSVEDSDLFLDALALSYEVAVHGQRSPWADYLCLLPRTYGGLPVHISDPRVSSLLSELPALRRLAAKRRAQLALFGEELATSALGVLPGGRSALARLAAASSAASGSDGSGGSGGDGDGRDLWLPLWHWAYAAAKTRSVTLAAEEVRHGGGGAPTGEQQLPLRLPMAMLEWVQEFGVMLPVLDLANHAFDGRGANVAYRILPDASGAGLAASFVALEPLTAGQPLLFDYVAEAEADQGPACVDRWLLEYGFVPDTTSDPARECDTFDITAADVARAVLRGVAMTTTSAPSTDDGPMGLSDDSQQPAAVDTDRTTVQPYDTAVPADQLASLETEIRERLSRREKDGLPNRLEVHVRQPYDGSTEGPQGDHVAQRWAVLQWLKAALKDQGQHSRHQQGALGQGGGGSGGGGDPAGAVVSELQPVAPRARDVLLAILQERWEQLGELERRAREGGGGDEGRGGAGRDAEARLGLAAVAAAGRRAVRRAWDQELARK